MKQWYCGKKEKLIVTILLLCVICILNACKKEDVSDVEIPERGIVFVQQHQNWAEGYQNYGTVVDINGNVYSFDFSDYNSFENSKATQYTDAEFVEELLNIYNTEEPVRVVDQTVVENCYKKIIAINKSSKRIEQSTGGADMGQNTVYVMSYDQSSLIELYSDGDWHRELDDKAAKGIVELYFGLMK